MRITSIAHRLSRLAVVVATLVTTLLAAPALWPGARLASAAGLEHRQGSARAKSPVNPGAAPTPAPGTPAEAARFAEREQKDASLGGFEGCSRISTTTVIIILLLVIILVLLL
jgi:hypothetical protein